MQKPIASKPKFDFRRFQNLFNMSMNIIFVTHLLETLREIDEDELPEEVYQFCDMLGNCVNRKNQSTEVSSGTFAILRFGKLYVLAMRLSFARQMLDVLEKQLQKSETLPPHLYALREQLSSQIAKAEENYGEDD